MIKSFHSAALPPLIFARGASGEIAQHIEKYGSNVLLLTDIDAQEPDVVNGVMHQLSSCQKIVTKISLSDVVELQNMTLPPADLVVSLGGARAIDFAKSMEREIDHISLPATVGMGAALIAGETGRLPDLVIADSAFLDGLARVDFAQRGLSVLCRLIESYVSPHASQVSDSLVWSGLEAFAQGFVSGLEGDEMGRDQVFYASLMSGAGVAQVGFGLIHALAQSLERDLGIDYAKASATLSFELLDLQIESLSERMPDSPALDKFAMCGELLAARPFEDREEAYASLIGTLRRWVARLEVGYLKITPEDAGRIAERIPDLEPWSSIIFSQEIGERLLRRARI